MNAARHTAAWLSLAACPLTAAAALAAEQASSAATAPEREEAVPIIGLSADDVESLIRESSPAAPAEPHAPHAPHVPELELGSEGLPPSSALGDAPAAPGPLSREYRDIVYADLAEWIAAMRLSDAEARDVRLIALLHKLNPMASVEMKPEAYMEALRLHHAALRGSAEALEKLADAFESGQLGPLRFVKDASAADYYRRRAASALPGIPR